MDGERSNLNPSSIIDLKAELHKKYELLRKAKLDRNDDLPKPTPFKNKLNAGKEKKASPIPIVKQNEDNSEEDLALKKSRLALETKARMYEKIISNQVLIDDEQNDLYQVDFQRKVLYETPALEKVEDSKYVDNSNTSQYNSTTSIDYSIYKQKILDPLVTTKKGNSKASEVNDPDQPIHYQNIQFNEVRDHGTGYFAFSMDEEKRKEQMEELSSMRQETEEQIIAKQKQQNKRKAMLQARLAKICERKNIDQSVLNAYKLEKTEAENTNTSPSQAPDLSSIPLPEPKQETVKKETKVRPWDIGKEGLQNFVPQKKQKIKSQNDYVEERRHERLSEFAPPSFYKSNS
ncbi:coiled-coil domain-containing protein 174 [Caerostris darwini]|uniref:Coiled-coil domain-containing protein 174 n=1 Tax=Caerostris darwini TaxID=1538125 RepID=A0AAV4VF21_9ARAC|nr:coiled-coil domain-containing protein 174 [Caerostris darwini]